MKYYLLFLCSFFASVKLAAQCEIKQQAFQEGEVLNYEMYFKYGIINTNAGKLSLSLSKDSYKGKGNLKAQFLIGTEGMANKFFAVQDTLSSYMTNSLVPVAYVKKAHEGDYFTDEVITYSYNKANEVDIHAVQSRNYKFRFDEQLKSQSCVYDLVSIIYFARTLDYENMKDGDTKLINFVSGKKLGTAEVELISSKKIKDNKSKRHDCWEVAIYFAPDDENGKKDKSKDFMKVYVSKDSNRVPISIETKLKKMGTIKGFFVSASGLRNN